MPAVKQAVQFQNGADRIEGDLYVPADHEGARLPAAVLSTPGSSVKEQIGANYARRLADRGIAALTFDPSHQGTSGGEPRDLEDPAARVEDLRCAIDYLTTLEVVDPARIGMLGICAGGGYAVRAAVMDRRVAALGTVVAVDIGRAMRAVAGGVEGERGALEQVATERSAEANGREMRRDPWIPDTLDDAKRAGITDQDVLQAVDFYRTPRGFNASSTNRLLFRSLAPLMMFDAFYQVDRLLTQPLQVIVGSRRASTGSREDGERLRSLAGNARDLFIIEGAGHYELYDQPEYIDPAADQLAAFYNETLRPAVAPQTAAV